MIRRMKTTHEKRISNQLGSKEESMWILRLTQTYIEDGGWKLSVTREFSSMSLATCMDRLIEIQEKLDVTSQVTLRFDGRK